MAFDIEALRKEFPILQRTVHGRPLIYFDNGASTQRPQAVIHRQRELLENGYANVHRGIHTLSAELTGRFEAVRLQLVEFLGAASEREIIFGSGTTALINLVASAWGEGNIQPGDTLLVTRADHHANFVPWQELAKRRGARFEIFELDSQGQLDLDLLERRMAQGVKVFAFPMVSNVLGTIFPVAAITALAKKHGVLSFCDAAQGVPHLFPKIADLGPLDFLTFSSHKVLGPTGLGVLWGREQVLRSLPPYQFGGDMIKEVGDQRTTWNDLPWIFEPGTPNIEGVIGFGAALDFLTALDRKAAAAYEHSCLERLVTGLKSIPGLKIFGPNLLAERSALVSFVIEGVHSHDLGSYLDSQGVAIRVGHHCAQPLHRALGVESSCRASLYFYNSQSEVDRFIELVEKGRRLFL